MSAISLFRSIKNKHDVYRDKDCMIKFCECLWKHAMKTMLKRKKMKSLINEKQNSFQNPKICYICKEKFEDKHTKDKTYWKVRDHCHYAGDY